MARRMVMGLRGSAYGLWISQAGHDALTASDANLLFTMTERAGMVLASGTVTVPSGGASARVSFPDTYPSIPLVFAGPLTNYPQPQAVSTQADTSGFFIRAVLDAYNNNYPAAGTTARWFAVMKTEN
ncbi:hypothetical protein [Microvirga sp. BSC39]|uniref:hypothetical protein n=1 Tax=Microvirga sp. BSC39 TaxID=1549810 RepID=UPI0004E9333E|nr:hypothetical protein [Microvirga sp. BSC39]KFG68710.1 hypothetical protein JH26_14680 [Microvirga sp. BSC39]